MENSIALLYVLELESDNFYIGVSYHINLSYAKHTTGQASKITKLYKPLCIKEVKLVESQSDLHKTVKFYRDAHGHDKIFVDSEEDSYEVSIVRKPTNTFVAAPQSKKVIVDTSSIQETVTADSPKPTVKKIRAPISFKKLQQPVEVFEDVLPAEPDQDEVKTEILENTETPKDNEIDPETKKLIQKEYWTNQYKKSSETKLKLKQEGKKLNDILTKDNLKKWLVDEGRSYSYIAREYAGCTNQMVSDIAKGFGLKSSKSPRDFLKFSKR